jgi:hypothetical protein
MFWSKNKTIYVQIPKVDYYKLQLICEDLNKHIDADVELTPEAIAARVIHTFVEEAYMESAKKMTKKLMNDLI